MVNQFLIHSLIHSIIHSSNRSFINSEVISFNPPSTPRSLLVHSSSIPPPTNPDECTQQRLQQSFSSTFELANNCSALDCVTANDSTSVLLTPSFVHSSFHSLPHSFTLSLSLSLSFTRSIQSLAHSFTPYSLTHSLKWIWENLHSFSFFRTVRIFS